MSAEAHLDHNAENCPPWGALALDCFMIDHWTASSQTNMSESEQRLALVRKFLEVGARGRVKYAEEAENGIIKPTDDQIETILRPLRTPTIRSIASKLQTLRGNGPLWIRTDYQSEERHQEYCGRELNCIDLGEGLHEDSTILSDERYYDVESWREILDFLPEIAVDHSRDRSIMEETYYYGDFRRKFERKYMESEPDSEGQTLLLAHQQHIAVTRFIIIEDREMFTTDPPLFHALWLDQYGDVVRENRILGEDACDYYVMVGEGAGYEQEVFSHEASIGSKYVCWRSG